MSLESDVRILRRVPLLASFADDQLRLLAFSAENRRLAAGTRLFSAGDRADSGYVVASGAVELMVTRGRIDVSIARLEPGELVGALALVVDGVRPNAAVVAEDSELIQIRRVLFRRMLEEYPEAGIRMRDHFAGELKTTTDALMRVRDRLTSLDE